MGVTAEADELLTIEGVLFGDIGEVFVGMDACAEPIT